jgi:hypothetical protein
MEVPKLTVSVVPGISVKVPQHVAEQMARARKVGLVISLAMFVLVAGGIAAALVFQKKIGTLTMNPYERGQVEVKKAVDQYGGLAAFDTIAYIPHATELARAKLPDAELTGFHAYYVAPDGKANLTLGTSGNIYQFRSPSASRLPPGTPRGVSKRLPCKAGVNVSQGHISHEAWVHEDDESGCKEPIVAPPKCTLVEVWQRAKKQGAPDDAVAWLMYRSTRVDEAWMARGTGNELAFDPDKPTAGAWRFTVDGGAGKSFYLDVPDDCGAAPAPAAETPPEEAEPPPTPEEAGRIQIANKIVQQQATKFRSCVEELKKTVTIMGDITVTYRITLDDAGRVKDVKDLTARPLNEKFMTCLVGKVKAIRFPRGLAPLSFTAKVSIKF